MSAVAEPGTTAADAPGGARAVGSAGATGAAGAAGATDAAGSAGTTGWAAAEVAEVGTAAAGRTAEVADAVGAAAAGWTAAGAVGDAGAVDAAGVADAAAAAGTTGDAGTAGAGMAGAVGVVDAPVRRRPGRPRDDELDRQIVAATLAVIDAGEEVTVSRVVSRSGVSRAALYRRWPSLTTLIAAALDVGREVPPEYPDDADLHEVLLTGLGLGADGVAPSAPGYSEERFRQRIRLVMADRALQKAYWESHVARRRVPLQNALRAGIARGELRDDLDVEACFDAIAGVAYYQLVVRGDRVSDPAVVARLRAAIAVIWRGMVSAS